MCRWFKGLFWKVFGSLLCGMWKELTIICDVCFLSKGFFLDMGSQPERFPPSHEYNNSKTFGPIPFVLFCLALPNTLQKSCFSN
jgi:hypothetical protein